MTPVTYRLVAVSAYLTCRLMHEQITTAASGLHSLLPGQSVWRPAHHPSGWAAPAPVQSTPPVERAAMKTEEVTVKPGRPLDWSPAGAWPLGHPRHQFDQGEARTYLHSQDDDLAAHIR